MPEPTAWAGTAILPDRPISYPEGGATIQHPKKCKVRTLPGSIHIHFRNTTAADKDVEIGDAASEDRARNNLAITLRKLRRLAEARQEIRRAIECKKGLGHAGSVWNAWSILANIETDAGNPIAAAEARAKAIDCYLAYRRDGDENHDGPGRLVFDMTQKLPMMLDKPGRRSVDVKRRGVRVVVEQKRP